ncbi:MAG TPA: hypothetical protein VE242_03220 [Chthoniobacterales bacterium]|nr:hypothetical protein [Chthoniobacterales bacterium]
MDAHTSSNGLFNLLKLQSHQKDLPLAELVYGILLVNRSICFFVFAFLFLFALLLVFSEELSRLSTPGPTFEPGNAVAQAGVQKATLTNNHSAGLLSDQAGIKVSFFDQRVDSSVNPPFSEAIQKIRVGPSYRKHRAHVVDRTRSAAKPGNHFRRPRFFSGLSRRFGAFISRL